MKKILAYRFSAFGDVVMTVPVFREFLEQNPDAEIIMVSRDNFKDLFDGLPRFTFKGIDFEQYKGFWGMNKLSKQLIGEFKPDMIADLHDVIRSKILNIILTRKGYRVYKIEKGKEEKKMLTDIKNLNKIQLKKTVERYADVFRDMGFPLTLSHQLRPISTHREGVGIAPFAQHEGKMLSLDKSFELARILSQNHKIYFFGGGKDEVEILSHWEKQLPNTESLAGKLSLRQEIEHISRLEVMISMDSANMHLASLAGTRCISIWGSTHPFAGFLGYGQSENDVVQIKDLTCRPCSVFGDKKCYRGDWACLNEISIQHILNKIE